MRVRAVLVVDDDLAMREMLVSLLEERDIEVYAAGNAEEALKLMKTAAFDVVLSDVQMPGKDGFWLLKAVRAARPGTPVILMTAFGTARGVVHALEAGAVEYLAKPFRRNELLAAVDRACGRQALPDDPSSPHSE